MRNLFHNWNQKTDLDDNRQSPNTQRKNTKPHPQGREISAIFEITTSNFRNQNSHNSKYNNKAQIQKKKNLFYSPYQKDILHDPGRRRNTFKDEPIHQAKGRYFSSELYSKLTFLKSRMTYPEKDNHHLIRSQIGDRITCRTTIPLDEQIEKYLSLPVWNKMTITRLENHYTIEDREWPDNRDISTITLKQEKPQDDRSLTCNNDDNIENKVVRERHKWNITQPHT